jgi:dinuclear metal center YbgI/SA1388 family protein
MKIRDIAAAIEEFAPLALQADYDNSGLVVGRLDDEVHKALLAVDVTEEILDEAEREGCDIIITHHPIIFSPLKRFNSATYVERCVERAIRKGIALYACHTNLDSTVNGMSWQVGSMIGLDSMTVL